MAPVRRSKGIRLYHLIQSTPCKSSLNIFDCIRKTHRRYFILWPPLPFIVHLLCCLGSNPNACIRIWADQRTRGYKMQIYLSIMCPQRIWTVNLLICSPQTAVVIKRGSYTNSSRWLKASFISPIANNTCLARAYFCHSLVYHQSLWEGLGKVTLYSISGTICSLCLCLAF